MNTQKGIAPRTTAGAGALAPAPEMLTIERDSVEIYLRRANAVGRALARFEKKMRRNSTGSAAWDDYWEAVHLLEGKWKKLVEGLRDRGGLLHLGRVW